MTTLSAWLLVRWSLAESSAASIWNRQLSRHSDTSCCLPNIIEPEPPLLSSMNGLTGDLRGGSGGGPDRGVAGGTWAWSRSGSPTSAGARSSRPASGSIVISRVACRMLSWCSCRGDFALDGDSAGDCGGDGSVVTSDRSDMAVLVRNALTARYAVGDVAWLPSIGSSRSSLDRLPSTDDVIDSSRGRSGDGDRAGGAGVSSTSVMSVSSDVRSASGAGAVAGAGAGAGAGSLAFTASSWGVTSAR